MLAFFVLLGGAAAWAPLAPARRGVAARQTRLRAFVTYYEELAVPTGRGVSMVDITASIKECVAKSGCKEGVATVLSKHSTVGVMLNEWEPRFVDDARHFLLKLAPREGPYLHNDLDSRVGPDGWPGGDEAWRTFRQGEPVNAHSHLIQFVVGTTESIPIHEGLLKIGTYQNVIAVDADGPVGTLGSPKTRTIVVQVQGSDA
ncbi:hypothetical protein M885DRAFT_465600 [Pelagophyceae sp. CCMP2097]|nr:hypothetical protein M885DRAFT_465600 [Pelagophyceae sp. CCMP2097]|mmetsp:Transcript_10516/g.36457  ORF Transcript_10516/g.36457 Transcript_10516/m.36457 type:complete len:202 (-) Transcript_10516:33-638(-)